MYHLSPESDSDAPMVVISGYCLLSPSYMYIDDFSNLDRLLFQDCLNL